MFPYRFWLKDCNIEAIPLTRIVTVTMPSAKAKAKAEQQLARRQAAKEKKEASEQAKLEAAAKKNDPTENGIVCNTATSITKAKSYEVSSRNVLCE